MSKTLHPFGTVLFDELGQIAVRRGGFASLEWLQRELVRVKTRMAGVADDAANPVVILPFLEETADRSVLDATQVLARAASTTDAVEQLGQIVAARVETALNVVKKLRKPDRSSGRVAAFYSLVSLVAMIRRWAKPEPDDAGWSQSRDRTRVALERQAARIKHARAELDKVDLSRISAEVASVEGKTARVRFIAQGLQAVKDIASSQDQAAAESILVLVNGQVGDRHLQERLARGAMIDRSARLTANLARAGEQVDVLVNAYRVFAEAFRVVPDLLSGLVARQSDEIRYEIGDIIEDGARATSLSLESVGLAFSGGGIRSATFNLGFLQGMASLRLLKHVDYLSTVSGGGYIGSWFAAWVRREGGTELEPLEERVTRQVDPQIKQEAARIQQKSKLTRAEVVASVKRAKRRILAKRECAQQQDLAEREQKSPRGPARTAIRRFFSKWRFRLAAIRGTSALTSRIRKKGKTPISESKAQQLIKRSARRIRNAKRHELKHGFAEDEKIKRRRIERALENVELQLNPKRAVQAQAVRRWVSADEIHKGREQDDPAPLSPPLHRVVEEEPQPIYHLRAFSNYLAPKLGVTSADTWTMVSVYLRNLFLNQFILLPMTLAAIAVPRLALILYAHLTTRSPFTLARDWLDVYFWWPSIAVLATATLAFVTVPKLVDYLLQEVGRRVKWASDPRLGGTSMFLLIGVALASVLWSATPLVLGWLLAPDAPGSLRAAGVWLDRFSWVPAAAVVPALILIGWARRQPDEPLVETFVRGVSDRDQGWAVLTIAVCFLSLLVWVASLGFYAAAPYLGRFTGNNLVFLGTVLLAWLGFARVYRSVALIRASRRPLARSAGEGVARYDLPYPVLWEQILIPLTLVAFGVSLLFSASAQKGPVPRIPTWLDLSEPLRVVVGGLAPALYFGILVGFLRLVTFLLIDLRDQLVNQDADDHDSFLRWEAYEKMGRGVAAFVSGLLAGTALAVVLSWMYGRLEVNPGLTAAAMLTFGPLMTLIAMGAGSAIEVGLIGKYREEDMREWRASLGAYLLMIGLGWTTFSAVSLYGPLLVLRAPEISSLAGVGWVFTSLMGALAGQSARTDGTKGNRSPLEYVALIAPPVFVLGLVLAVATLATNIQLGAAFFRPETHSSATAFLNLLSATELAGRTWVMLLVAAWLATVGCVYVNINLFSLNTFYANRLVRCYLGASRPRESTAEGRSMFAPTNCPVPVRRPNPLTGFDPSDDFPLSELAIVRNWDKDLVVDYRGPYHLINTSMNLVAGSELAWQERMAESFVISPLYCGSKSTGFRKTVVRRGDLLEAEVEPEERDFEGHREVPGFGDNVRLGTAVSVSGAAASPNAGYHSSPLVTILLTVLNARLGLWFGNPAQESWRKSGPGFALYLFDELLGRTTSKGKYVYLSDGGHFENLGVYELIRRRCRHIVVCDAGADPSSSFWDLGSLVRKCREDLGVRIEIDISPLLKEPGSTHAKWHCAVGQIHYEDVDESATPGTLFYVKPSLTGDEPSDVRNYVVDHPSYPHESTADQFFSESQFESYRVLGEHIATEVFRGAMADVGMQAKPKEIFSRLRRLWFPPPPGHDETFLESIKPFVDIHKSLRSDAGLKRFAAELYPEAARLGSKGDVACRKELHAVIEMLQAMETAWIKAGLASHASHPVNRGWMNVFRRWANSSLFQEFWPEVRGEFSEGFVRFCENELNLKVDDSEVAWLEPGLAKPWGTEQRTAADLLKALTTLDNEFRLEWPRLSLPEVGDQATTLSALSAHAASHPAVVGFGPLVGLIVARPSPRRNGLATGDPRLYGAVIAWKGSEDVIDLMIWIRGAYRTLGIGRKGLEATQAALDRSGSARGKSFRARYPSEFRNSVKGRWQGELWAEFFQSQGFHRAGHGPELNGSKFVTLKKDI